ncbi:TonB-dependent receptor [Alteromonadaceae bacterium BrNp21-10]|nr:TonB-dependent receptor [Alteromonadaceae bacterium BrNp21-10]
MNAIKQKNSSSFKVSALALSVAASLYTGSVLAQDADTEKAGDMEVINVSGIRGSQVASIFDKRSAANVVDSISAVDIGKLPDVTISDSLQRISGVQVRRSAGEGAQVNVRGLPQVMVTLNGEQYIGANSINSVQPNFTDIPSQLFNGVSVAKTSQANMVFSGITGSIDLQTYRPFDFDEGFSGAAQVEFQRGQDSGETDPLLSGLVAYNSGKFGALFSVSYSNPHLANYYNGFNTTSATGDAGSLNGINAWGATSPTDYISPQGYVALQQINERERLGVNASFQADLGDGFELVADVFYTDQEDYFRKVGLSATNRWATLDWFTPTQSRATGDDNWDSYQAVALDVRRLKSWTQNDSFNTFSRNINLELNYDNGGAFTGSARIVSGKAENQKRHGYNEGDLSAWTGDTKWQLPNAGPDGANFYPAEACDSGTIIGNRGEDGGCFLVGNINGYTSDPQLTIDTNGEFPVWGGFDSMVSTNTGSTTVGQLMSNEQSYTVGAYSSENNANSTGSIDAVRFDGKFALEEGFFTSIEGGFRQSWRSNEEYRYHLFSPFWDEGTNGQCEAQWKAVDVNCSAAGAGEIVNGEFMAYTALVPMQLSANNNVIWVDDFGPLNGIPGVWAADPKDYDDPLAFHNRVFGETREALIPGSSYNVDFNETSFYLQANFEHNDWSGNFGARLLSTELRIRQNVAGNPLPNGNTNVDIGDTTTTRTWVDFLPAVNVTYQATDDVVVRFAYTENTTPLNLNQWADGLVVNTVVNSDSTDDVPDGVFTVSSANQNGNPELDPWYSTNYDLSIEYYMGEASMFSMAAFLVDIDSFTTSGTFPAQIADNDGVVRRTTNVTTNLPGEGGEISGMELSAKLAFSDLFDEDSVLANFGVDTNFTYSPSEQDALDIAGNKMQFPDNSETQFNLALWYQSDVIQARLAVNDRSERLAVQNVAGANLNAYQKGTTYVDLSVSYDVTEDISVYLQGSNITGEYEEYYLEWEDQFAWQNYYESRYTVGVRAKF